jgi:hypothetical protein
MTRNVGESRRFGVGNMRAGNVSKRIVARIALALGLAAGLAGAWILVTGPSSGLELVWVYAQH